MLTSGCTSLNFRSPLEPQETPLAFMARAAAASPAARESIWRSLRNPNTDPDYAAKVALMQSLPSHSGYDPATAQRRLRAVAAREPNTQAGMVARIRVAEIGEHGAREAEISNLQQRLAKIVDIERSLDRDGTVKKPDPAR